MIMTQRVPDWTIIYDRRTRNRNEPTPILAVPFVAQFLIVTTKIAGSEIQRILSQKSIAKLAISIFATASVSHSS
jgi:hypothetical protein